MAILSAGTRAPDFTLHSTHGQPVARSEFRGRKVILAFYPADWSAVGGDPSALLDEADILSSTRRLVFDVSSCDFQGAASLRCARGAKASTTLGVFGFANAGHPRCH